MRFFYTSSSHEFFIDVIEIIIVDGRENEFINDLILLLEEMLKMSFILINAFPDQSS